jgi:hypothetical protein
MEKQLFLRGWNKAFFCDDRSKNKLYDNMDAYNYCDKQIASCDLQARTTISSGCTQYKYLRQQNLMGLGTRVATGAVGM